MKTLITTCLLLAGITAQAQQPIPFLGSNDRYGLKNQDGKIILEPKYEGIANFSDGLAMINTGDIMYNNSLYGFIDATGKEVIPLKYRIAWDFRDGLAKVQYG